MPAVVRVSAHYTLRDGVSAKLSRMAAKVTALEKALGGVQSKFDKIEKAAKRIDGPLGDVNKQLKDMRTTIGTKSGTTGLQSRVTNLNKGLNQLAPKQGHVIKLKTTGVKSSENELRKLHGLATDLSSGKHTIKIDVDKNSIDMLRDQAAALREVKQATEGVRAGFGHLKQGEAELRKTMRVKTQAAEQQRVTLSKVERQTTRVTREQDKFRETVRRSVDEQDSFVNFLGKTWRELRQTSSMFRAGVKAGTPMPRMFTFMAAGANVAGVALGGLTSMIHGLIAPALSIVSTFKDMVGVLGLLPAAYGAVGAAVLSTKGAMDAFFGDTFKNAQKLGQLRRELATVTDPEERKALLEQQSKLMGTMTKQQQKLANQVVGLGKAWRQTFTSNTALQKAFFKTATRGIATAKSLLLDYRGDLQSTANQVRMLAERMMDVAEHNENFRKGISAVFRIARGITAQLRKALEPLMSFLGKVLQASEKPILRIVRAFTKWIARLDATTSVKDLERFFNKGVTTAGKWMKILGNIAKAFNNIFRAGQKETDSFLDTLVLITTQFKVWTGGAGFPLIRKEFEEGMKVAKALGRFVKGFVKEFMELGANGEAGSAVVEFIDMLTGGLPRFFRFMETSLTQLGPSMTRLVDSFGEFSVLFEGVLPAVKMLLDFFAKINETLASMPEPVQRMLGFLVSMRILAFGVGTAFGSMFSSLASGVRMLQSATTGVQTLSRTVRGMPSAPTGGGALSRGLGRIAGPLNLAADITADQNVHVTNVTPIPVFVMGGGPNFFRKMFRGGRGAALAGGGAATAATARAGMLGRGVGQRGIGSAAQTGYYRARAQGAGRFGSALRGGRGGWMAATRGGALAGQGTAGLAGTASAFGKVGKVAGKAFVPLTIAMGTVSGLNKGLQDTQGFVSSIGSASKGFLQGIDPTGLIPGMGGKSLADRLPTTGAEISAIEQQGMEYEQHGMALSELNDMRAQIYNAQQAGLQGQQQFLREQLKGQELSKLINRQAAIELGMIAGMSRTEAAKVVRQQHRRQQQIRVNRLQKEIEEGKIKGVKEATERAKQLKIANAGLAAQTQVQEFNQGERHIGGKEIQIAHGNAKQQEQAVFMARHQPGYSQAVAQGTTPELMTSKQFEAAKTKQAEIDAEATRAQERINKMHEQMKTMFGEAGVMAATAMGENHAALMGEMAIMQEQLETRATEMYQQGIITPSELEQVKTTAFTEAQKNMRAYEDGVTTQVNTTGTNIKGRVDYWGTQINTAFSSLGSGAMPTTAPPPTGGGTASTASNPFGMPSLGPTAGGAVVPGDPRRPDSVHALLKPGEVVLNEGQQQKLGKTLVKKSMVGPGTAAKGNFGFNMMDAPSSAMRYAGGGTVPELKPYMDAAVKLGGIITSTTGGTHAAGSYHYSGQAFDVDGGPATNMKIFRAFEGDAKRGALAELFFDPAGGYKHGQSIGAIGGHMDHVHAAVTAGAIAGALGLGPPPKLPAPPDFGKSKMGQAAQKKAQAMVPGLQAQLNAAHAATGGYGPDMGGAAAGSNQQIGQQMAAAMGWSGGEWGALKELWTRESHWDNLAENKSSGAYGIPQALPPTKLPPAGQKSGGSQPSAQIGWGLNYIKGRYGSPSGALAHHDRMNWYGKGGSGIADKPQVIGVGDRKEQVDITPTSTQAKPGSNLGGGGGAKTNITNNFYIGVLSGDRKALQQLASEVGAVIAKDVGEASSSYVEGSRDVMIGNG